MTEREYRQDDRTIGYCPLCGEQVTDVMTDGGGWCPDHGRVWVNWDAPRERTTAPEVVRGYDGLPRIGHPRGPLARTQTEPKTTASGRTSFECAYPACSCQHICNATGREVGRRSNPEEGSA